MSDSATWMDSSTLKTRPQQLRILGLAGSHMRLPLVLGLLRRAASCAVSTLYIVAGRDILLDFGYYCHYYHYCYSSSYCSYSSFLQPFAANILSNLNSTLQLLNPLCVTNTR